MRTHFRALEDPKSLFSLKCEMVIKKRHIYNITHFLTKAHMLYIQGVSKKIVHSDFCLLCVLKVQFYFFTCDMESEF